MKKSRPFGATDIAHPGGSGSSLSSLLAELLSNVSVLCKNKYIKVYIGGKGNKEKYQLKSQYWVYKYIKSSTLHLSFKVYHP